jgi:hypothetical protein
MAPKTEGNRMLMTIIPITSQREKGAVPPFFSKALFTIQVKITAKHRKNPAK